jgi:hypothetical protein
MTRRRDTDPDVDELLEQLGAGAPPPASPATLSPAAAGAVLRLAAADDGPAHGYPRALSLVCGRCGASTRVPVRDALDACSDLTAPGAALIARAGHVAASCPRCDAVAGGPVDDVAVLLAAAVESTRRDRAYRRAGAAGREHPDPAVTLPPLDPRTLL